MGGLNYGCMGLGVRDAFGAPEGNAETTDGDKSEDEKGLTTDIWGLSRGATRKPRIGRRRKRVSGFPFCTTFPLFLIRGFFFIRS